MGSETSNFRQKIDPHFHRFITKYLGCYVTPLFHVGEIQVSQGIGALNTFLRRVSFKPIYCRSFMPISRTIYFCAKTSLLRSRVLLEVRYINSENTVNVSRSGQGHSG